MRASIETVEPTDAARQSISVPLVAFNESVVGSQGYAPFAILIRDAENGTAVGGLWAEFLNDWLHVDLLFVPESLRRSGVGTKIMRAAEALATEKQCVGIWLDTYSFQAPGFYGIGRLPDHPRGHDRVFLRKLLGNGVRSPGSG